MGDGRFAMMYVWLALNLGESLLQCSFCLQRFFGGFARLSLSGPSMYDTGYRHRIPEADYKYTYGHRDDSTRTCGGSVNRSDTHKSS
jgi:hypothetical protein